ncbi:hypothetical protein Avbf_02866 [Armadillidium vulgare]|nr:hypothetical protein Avbf_02866 [Armadillidium vulgare]
METNNHFVQSFMLFCLKESPCVFEYFHLLGPLLTPSSYFITPFSTSLQYIVKWQKQALQQLHLF